jgi:hypothetical protein
MSEAALDKKRIISELTKSAHGKLDDYLPIGRQAALEDPDFFAHLVAWNHQKGQVRDAKIALPVIALAAQNLLSPDAERLRGMAFPYADNALAHLADLRPRELARVALTTTRLDKTQPKKPKSVSVPPFGLTARAPRRLLRRLVTRYLRDLETNRGHFEYVAVQHRRVLHDLYAHYHVTRPDWVGHILFHGEKGHSKELAPGIFNVIARLHRTPVEEAAGLIVKYKIPFLIARGALGAKANEPDTVLALIKAMSPTELVTNMGWLEKLGVKTNPALRGALELALGNAVSSPRAKATLKTSRAAEAMADDEVLSTKLHAVQEKQLDKLGGVDGDWLVLGDKSGSMQATIKLAATVAATLTRMVKGKVHLIFFDTMPYYMDASGKTLQELTVMTQNIIAGGGTSIGCGLQYLLDRKIKVDGIAIVSDGGENHTPQFGTVYTKYAKAMDVEPTVYLYQTLGESDYLFNNACAAAELDVQRFDLRGQTVDYYSIPNLTQTMRVQRYSLVDEIMACPLRTLDEVLDHTKGMAVLPQSMRVNV